jgi:hypothetical protein
MGEPPASSASLSEGDHDAQCSLKTLPPMQTIRRPSLPSGQLTDARRRSVDSATNRRDTALGDVACSAEVVPLFRTTR